MNASTRQKPHTVYLHRDALGRVLYVGCSMNLRQRTREHRSRSSWFGDVSSVDIDSVQPDIEAGRAREAALIRRYEPPNNILQNWVRAKPRRRRSSLEAWVAAQERESVA